MSIQSRVSITGGRRIIAGLLLAITGMSAGMSAGCSDPRISLQEFLELQAHYDQMEASKSPEMLDSQAVANIDQGLGRYKAAPGDVLTLSVTGLEMASPFDALAVRVDREGNIELPTAGKVNVQGKELEDIEAAVRGAYVPKVYQDIVVHVTIAEPEQTRVLVLGAAGAPGLIGLRASERNLLYAIIGAGGATNSASGEVTLRRLRKPSEEVTLNLQTPEGLRAALALDPLENGDIVTVKAATPNTVFVGGLVNGPRPQLYPPGTRITVLQALAASGGLRTDLTPREGTLIRRMPDGHDVHVKLDLDRIASAQDPNITLLPGDVFWVPHTAETQVQEFIQKHFFFQSGVTATAGANYNYSMQAIDYGNSNAQDFNQSYNSASDPFGAFLNSLRSAAVPLSQPIVTPVP